MSVPEIIPLTKLQRYEINDLFVKVVSIIKSVNPATCPKEEAENDEMVAPTDDISNKNANDLSELKILRLKKYSEQITEFKTAPCHPDTFHSN